MSEQFPSDIEFPPEVAPTGAELVKIAHVLTLAMSITHEFIAGRLDDGIVAGAVSIDDRDVGHMHAIGQLAEAITAIDYEFFVAAADLTRDHAPNDPEGFAKNMLDVIKRHSDHTAFFEEIVAVTGAILHMREANDEHDQKATVQA